MSLPPSKKRKLSSKGSFSSQHQKTIKTLEEKLNDATASGTSLNCLTDLVQLTLKLSEAADVYKAIWSLYRVFTRLIQEHRLLGAPLAGSSSGSSAESKTIQRWLAQKFGEYTSYLVSLLHDNEQALRISSLQLSMELLRSTSSAISAAAGQPQLYMLLWRKLLENLIKPSVSLRQCGYSDADSMDEDRALRADVKEAFSTKYLNCDDVRWFFLRDAPKCLGGGTATPAALTLLAFVETMDGIPQESAKIKSFWIPAFGDGDIDDEESDNLEGDEQEAEDDWRIAFREDHTGENERGSIQQDRSERNHQLSTSRALRSARSHRYQFTACWFALLPHLKGSEAASMRVLNVLQHGVMPNLTKPVRLHDWVAGCVDFGGPAGLLALNALFALMQHHHLDYPSFYPQLYKFLDGDLLHLKFRSRFFRLAEVFLSSTHLPAVMVASFIKRLSRLSLSAPPAAIVSIIPFTYNLLKRHPTLMAMIHRHGDLTEDTFKMGEPNPYLTNAIDSSLWELTSHRSHYHHNVATLAQIFEAKFTKPHFGLEDFLDHTYSTMLSTELKGKMRGEPAMATDAPNRIFFVGQTAPQGTPETVDAVGELWTF